MFDITIPAMQAALLNLGGATPLVMLIVVLLILGLVWMIWSKVCMPLLANVIGEPFLNIVNWIVIAILIVIAISKVFEVVFGISVFNMG